MADELYPEELRNELAELPRPHPSFLVSLLTREESAIQAFRGQIEVWWSHLDEEPRQRYAPFLRAIENEDFFQGFGELAVHEILLHHGIRVKQFAEQPGGWMEAVSADGEQEFGLSVVSYLPEVQVRGSMSVYRHLIRALNQIHHHYYFSVYLKKWLPYDFDPRPIKRALDVWLDSLDDGSWHGKYAEYKDENIHLEFSILDKLNEDHDNLVRFRISPLEAPTILERVQECVDQILMNTVDNGAAEKPLVATVFSNEGWRLPTAYLQDYVYGKADYCFTWTTHGGRKERVTTFRQEGSKYGIFSDERYKRVSAVILADKEWERDKVVFSFQVLHNPWAARPLSGDCFGVFAQVRTIDSEGDAMHLAWENPGRARFRLP